MTIESDVHPSPEQGDLSILADNAHNQRLRSHVHPSDWVNPTPDGRYNMVVIGAGTAGLVTAGAAAGLGARVALIERHLMGGDCLNTGCVPSKALLHSARTAARHRTPGHNGSTGQTAPDFHAAMERMRSLRADISAHDSAQRFKDMGIDVYFGEAVFTGRETISVSGTELGFVRACIATGARPVVPPIEGLDKVDPLTNENVFSLTALPPRLAVVGGGPIGCEMAQAFARFGSSVTIIEMSDRLLGNDHPDAAAIVHCALQRDGVAMELSSKLTAASKQSGGAIDLAIEASDGSRTLAVDAVLVAVGRRPNVESLDLKAGGIATSKHGIDVDDRLQTSNSSVYAAGDVCSKYKFTHAADAMARTVARNALLPGSWSVDQLVIPWCTYTDPELAHVGVSAEEARQTDDLQAVRIDFSDVDRAVLDQSTEGFVEITVDRRGRLKGGTIVGPHAGEMIGELTLALTQKLSLSDLSNTIHPYPTLAEALRKAGDQFQRTRLRPWMTGLLDRWFSWQRR